MKIMVEEQNKYCREDIRDCNWSKGGEINDEKKKMNCGEICFLLVDEYTSNQESRNAGEGGFFLV